MHKCTKRVNRQINHINRQMDKQTNGKMDKRQLDKWTKKGKKG